jgi:hypothetical protein
MNKNVSFMQIASISILFLMGTMYAMEAETRYLARVKNDDQIFVPKNLPPYARINVENFKKRIRSYKSPFSFTYSGLKLVARKCWYKRLLPL